ncbi:MAG: FkbM family methyltransferase [Limisphaerales bacterium]|jgi:FkbM family methyltransferase
MNWLRKFKRGLRAVIAALRTGAPVAFVVKLEKCRIPYSFKRGLLEIEVWGAKVILRRGGSDAKCVEELCIDGQYNLTTSILTKNGATVGTILDLGGNMGLASLQFASEFPEAKCIILEPDPENAKRAREHLGKCANVELIEAGIWSKSGTLYTSREYADGLDWAITVSDTKSESSVDEIPAIGIEDLIQTLEIEVIDLLKIDIEGAEGELFREEVAAKFLPLTRVIALEVHDALVSRSQIEMMLKSHGFVLFQDGELTVGINARSFGGHKPVSVNTD